MGHASSASARRQTSGLPAEVSSFIGRRREAAEVKRLLSASRLVTLTGAGGVGKSRLASRVAADLWRAFPDGVRLVELSGVPDEELLLPAVARAVPVDDESPESTVDTIADRLRDRRSLIVLDNCEHLVHACAALAGELLRSAPGLRILATSRQPLGIPSEQVFAVLPLSLPTSGPLAGGPGGSGDAVRLFSERAEAVLPGFTISAANRDAVEKICRRLDGIPLALELAALRLRALSPAQLLSRLDDRFRLLTSGSTAVPPRHRSLRALIDYSHELCTDAERRLWARVSVFSGSLDLVAAEAVCAGDGLARGDVIDLIIGLVDKSVLIREEHSAGVRYRLLETIGQYGRERLAASGLEPALRRRHRDYFHRLSVEAYRREPCPAQPASLTLLRTEHGNLTAALESCFAEPAAARMGLIMATDLLYHWVTGHVDEGRRWLDRALSAEREPSEDRAWALCAAAWLTARHSDAAGATPMLDEAAAIGERLGSRSVLAWVALHSGLAAMARDDAVAAVTLCEQAIERQRADGDDAGLTLALSRLSLACSGAGDVPRAVRCGEEAVSVCGTAADDWYAAYAMTALGIALWCAGDIRRATTMEEEALRFNRMIEDPLGSRLNLGILAWIAATDQDHERAARLLGFVRAAERGAGAPLSACAYLARQHAECESATREALGEAAFQTAAQGGAGLPYGDAVAFALREGRRTVREERPDHPVALTRREAETARLVARGLTNKEIAAALVIAERTAEGHVGHVLDKLGFTSRAQIAAWVAEQSEDRDR